MPPLLSRRLSPPAGAALSLFALVAPLSRSCDLNVTGQEKPRRRRRRRAGDTDRGGSSSSSERQRRRRGEHGQGCPAVPPPHPPPQQHRRQVSAHRLHLPGLVPTCRPRPGLREGGGWGAGGTGARKRFRQRRWQQRRRMTLVLGLRVKADGGPRTHGDLVLGSEGMGAPRGRRRLRLAPGFWPPDKTIPRSQAAASRRQLHPGLCGRGRGRKPRGRVADRRREGGRGGGRFTFRSPSPVPPFPPPPRSAS